MFSVKHHFTTSCGSYIETESVVPGKLLLPVTMETRVKCSIKFTPGLPHYQRYIKLIYQLIYQSISLAAKTGQCVGSDAFTRHYSIVFKCSTLAS